MTLLGTQTNNGTFLPRDGPNDKADILHYKPGLLQPRLSLNTKTLRKQNIQIST